MFSGISFTQLELEFSDCSGAVGNHDARSVPENHDAWAGPVFLVLGLLDTTRLVVAFGSGTSTPTFGIHF